MQWRVDPIALVAWYLRDTKWRSKIAEAFFNFGLDLCFNLSKLRMIFCYVVQESAKTH
jgi:hypothetical protein